MEGGRRRLDHPLRLSSLPVRHGADHGNRARACRSRFGRSRRRAKRARRHEEPLAEGALCRRRRHHGGVRQAYFRSVAVAAERTAARRPDRHRLGGPGLGGAVENPDGQSRNLFGDRRQSPHACCGARRRRRGRQKSDLLRRAVPPRHRQERRTDRLSLGHHPQTRHARLGSGAGRARRKYSTPPNPASRPPSNRH